MSIARPRRLWALALALALLAAMVAPVRAVAAGAVDLIIQLQVPATARAGEAFEARMTITNRSGQTATGSTLTLTMDAGTTDLAASAGPTVNGASPAEDLRISGTTVTGTIPSLPMDGTTTVIVAGRYPTSSSAAFRASVQAGPQDTEQDPSTNTVTQNTSLDQSRPRASVTVTKTQDKETVASGETRIYTVTYKNTGTTNINGLNIVDFYYNQIVLPNNQTSYITYAITCDPSSTAPCPTWANGTTKRDRGSAEIISSLYMDNRINLPVNTQLTLKIPITHTVSCLPEGTATIRNSTSASPPDRTTLTNSTTSADSQGTLTAPECAPDTSASVTVTKTQDKETVASGETRIYTVTYANTGTTDLNSLDVEDVYRRYEASGPAATYSITCHPSSTAPCPTWADGTTQTIDHPPFLFKDRINLPAGTQLILTIPVTRTVSCLPNGMVTGYNEASLDKPFGIELINSTTYARVDGTIRTTDVTTTTKVSTSLPDPEQELRVSAEVSNNCGTATDVPVTITLPRQGMTVEAGATPTCTASGTAVCPTDLTYNPATRTVTGTVPTLPQGSSVVLGISAKAAHAPAPTNSYSITTTAPDPWDLAPATNTSSTTFALSAVRTDVTITHTVEGLPPTGAPQTMSFPGTLTCTGSGTHTVLVTIAAGSTQGQVVQPQSVFLRESCSLSITRPEAPGGYTWTTSTPPGISEPSTEVTAPIERAYTWRLERARFTPPALPLTGGTGADAFTLSGLGLAFLAALAAILRRRAHRAQP